MDFVLNINCNDYSVVALLIAIRKCTHSLGTKGITKQLCMTIEQ